MKEGEEKLNTEENLEVICLQENLKNGLIVSERIAGKNSSLPILNNALLEADKGFLKISSTDLEIGVEVLIPCKVEKKGSVVVPVKFLLNFINNIPNVKIKIKEDSKNISVDTDNLKTKIPKVNKDDFPIIPKVKNSLNIKIKGGVIKKSLEQVLNSVSLSETKPEITGVLFDFKKDILNIVSTDVFRLSEKTILNNNIYNVDESKSFIIPQKTAIELFKVIDSNDDLIININNNQVSFLFNKINLTSRVIDGDYPNYKQIIPKEQKTKIILDKEDFLSKVKLASLFSSNINDVIFKIDTKNNKFYIESEDKVKGNLNSEVEFIKLSGDSLDIVFNWRYVIDGLSNLDGDEIIFELNSNSSPAVLRSTGFLDYIYIIMPIKQ